MYEKHLIISMQTSKQTFTVGDTNDGCAPKPFEYKHANVQINKRLPLGMQTADVHQKHWSINMQTFTQTNVYRWGCKRRMCGRIAV